MADAALARETVPSAERYAHKTFDKYASSEVCRDAPGEIVVMSGDEAVARGAVEAGVYVASSYPGSPTTYILDSLAYAAKAYDFHVEWSTNEKVAFEVALGAAMCGKDAMTITKNVGMSWFMDPLINCVSMGLSGALVLVIGDDPGANTTSVEEDCRFLGMAAEIPILEPTTSQEIKDLTVEAFEMSRRLGIPVMLRITRAQCYGRGPVRLGPINHERRQVKPEFDHDPIHWTCNVSPEFLGENLAFLRHKRFHEKVVHEIGRAVNSCSFNKLKLNGSERVGVISAGMSYLATMEAIRALGLEDKVAVLKLATTYPIPQELVKELLQSVETVLVVEEIEPFIEFQVRDLTAELDKHAAVVGKKTGHIRTAGCVDRDEVAKALSSLCNIPYQSSLSPRRQELFEEIIQHQVVHRPQGYFCPGCPEMAGIYSAKRVAKKLFKGKFISHGDIGCYEHAHAPPWDFLHSVLCMGAGPGMGAGNYHAGIGEKIICNLGDSTFFHAAIPALINAVYNKVDITFLIYDNRCTASTGHQPHPGAFGVTAKDEPTKIINIEDVSRACQVDYVGIADPYNVEQSLKVVEEAYRTKGVSVVIFRQVCAVVSERQQGGKAKAKLKLYGIERELCEWYKKGVCLICIKDLGCPSIMKDDQSLYIDPITCFGCGVCAQVCPFKAIRERVRVHGR